MGPSETKFVKRVLEGNEQLGKICRSTDGIDTEDEKFVLYYPILTNKFM